MRFKSEQKKERKKEGGGTMFVKWKRENELVVMSSKSNSHRSEQLESFILVRGICFDLHTSIVTERVNVLVQTRKIDASDLSY